MKLVQKIMLFFFTIKPKTAGILNDKEIMEIKRKNEAIHDRLLGPNQNGGKGYELPAIFNNPLSDD